MTTLNKIAYDIAHTLGKDTDMSFIERIKFRIHQHRAELLRRDLDRNRFTPSQYLQTIGCLEMEFVDGSSCCGVEVGCKVYRSKLRVPEPIRFKDKKPFYFVGTIDGMTGYSSMSPYELSYYSHSKYGAAMPRYFWQDGYIYVLGTVPKSIQVRGVFEYPNELAAFTNCDDSKCYSDDDPYPISVDLVKVITQSLLGFDATRERIGENDDVTINKE